ncbi:FadR/GntR family transcriptional regulator [Peribacillus sp. NPDC097198]|uniref:FadR/GntR family transcriptional regulator n=1 Tax=unclassified Peribacillus TaxID=2675266 RepID=UPI00381E1532
MTIHKTSLVTIAIERIKSHILENNLKPNDKFLTEKELVEQLQVSRTVIREALISLQTVGILNVKPGGGVYIAEPTLDSINTILKHYYDTHGVKMKELMEIREVIELGALRLIIEKQVDVDIDHLISINESYYQTIIQKQDTKQFDRLFHQALIKSTENEAYFKFSEVISEYFSLVRMDFIEKEDTLIDSFKQHADIIDAIKIKDLPVAQKVLKEHFQPIFRFITTLEEANGTH